MIKVGVLLLLFLPLVSDAQVDSSDISHYHKNFFLSFLFPKGIAEGVALRSYLRSSSWDELRKKMSDREAFDEIFEDAAELCNGNKTDAILSASVAVLEHKTIPIKLFFGIVVSIPLTLENQQDFSSRIEKLPAHIYDPAVGDVDKLQHFFFSAFFTRVLKMNWLVRLLGNGVEIGEELFVEGGSNDRRDKHANEDGIHFGQSGSFLPSSFLTPNP